MKKRICALLAAMLLTGAAASADGLDFLKPIGIRRKRASRRTFG